MFGLAIFARLLVSTQMAAVGTHGQDGKTIVRLASQHNDISVIATDRGVRYSAIDKSGRVLVSNATLDDLKQQHPDLYRQLAPATCDASDRPTAYAGMAGD
jgi:hypothetical protein